MTNAERFWDEIYNESGVKVARLDDSTLNSALRHFGDVRGARILDLGCGAGEASLFFAEHGAKVVSIDTSESAIRLLRKFCKARDIDNVKPLLMSAEDIEDIGPFDFVYGSFILHHIEPFSEFACTLRGSLAPGGKAFFHENNSSSSILMWFRENVVGKLWIPKHGDEDEYPLSSSEIDLLRSYFDVRIQYPEVLFFRLISSYFLNDRIKRPFEWMDRFMYRFRSLRHYSYRQDVLLG